MADGAAQEAVMVMANEDEKLPPEDEQQSLALSADGLRYWLEQVRLGRIMPLNSTSFFCTCESEQRDIAMEIVSISASAQRCHGLISFTYVQKSASRRDCCR